MSSLDEIMAGYVECALWSSSHMEDEDSTPVPFDEVDAEISDETMAQMREEVRQFVDANNDDLLTMDNEQIGHDFWLTRNHHGAGFWDRGLGEKGDRLTKSAQTWGACDLYLGNDGKIHCQ